MESQSHNIELGFSDLFSVYLETINHLNLKFSIFCRNGKLVQLKCFLLQTSFGIYSFLSAKWFIHFTKRLKHIIFCRAYCQFY